MFDGLISGFFNFLSNANTNAANKAMTEDTNRMNLQISREKYANDVAMWNAQNAYNTPAAQMERLRAAGLNPQLVYAKGLSNTTTGYPQAPSPEMKAPHLQAYTGFNIGLFNGLMALKQLDNDTKLKDAQKVLYLQEAQNKAYYLGRDKKTEDAYVKTINEQLKKLQNDNSLFDLRKDNLDMDLQLKTQQKNKLHNDTEYERYKRDNISRGIDVEGGAKERYLVLLSKIIGAFFGVFPEDLDRLVEKSSPIDRKNYDF